MLLAPVVVSGVGGKRWVKVTVSVLSVSTEVFAAMRLVLAKPLVLITSDERRVVILAGQGCLIYP